MRNAFFIVGPTAIGKTEVAVEVAERCGAEIVSADAYQVYRGLDLLTAKPTPDQRRRVTHHLIGELEPVEEYSVARFQADATRALERVARTGKPAIVVGGSGLYVKSLTHGLSPLPPADPALRAELEALPAVALLARLGQLDPVAHAKIDHQNLRRVVRAVEVCLLTGKPFSSFQTTWQEPVSAASPQGVFLRCERTDLLARIDQRVDTMFALGVIEEVRRMQDAPLSATARQILGLSEIQAHMAGQTDLASCQNSLKIATRQYAKRQTTWFQRETCFTPVRGNAQGLIEQIHRCFLAWQEARSA